MVNKIINKIINKIYRIKKNIVISKTKRKFLEGDITIISQNCIGSMFCHDMKVRYQSPTVNLFMNPGDFIKFVQDLERYIQIKPVINIGDKGYPVGKIGDITLYFMHYHTAEEAFNKWEERKKRILWNRVFVIGADGGSYSSENLAEFKKIRHPKLLFTSNKQLKNEEDCIYVKWNFKKDKNFDMIEYGDMYKKNILVEKINKLVIDND
jgi:uncharacterized protein (DUF1919 family)